METSVIGSLCSNRNIQKGVVHSRTVGTRTAINMFIGDRRRTSTMCRKTALTCDENFMLENNLSVPKLGFFFCRFTFPQKTIEREMKKKVSPERGIEPRSAR